MRPEHILGLVVFFKELAQKIVVLIYTESSHVTISFPFLLVTFKKEKTNGFFSMFY